MTTWEYLSVESVNVALTELGSYGWELCAVINCKWYFKRPKEPERMDHSDCPICQDLKGETLAPTAKQIMEVLEQPDVHAKIMRDLGIKPGAGFK